MKNRLAFFFVILATAAYAHDSQDNEFELGDWRVEVTDNPDSNNILVSIRSIPKLVLAHHELCNFKTKDGNWAGTITAFSMIETSKDSGFYDFKAVLERPTRRWSAITGWEWLNKFEHQFVEGSCGFYKHFQHLPVPRSR